MGAADDDDTRSRTLPVSTRTVTPGMVAHARFALVVIEGPDAGVSFEIDGARPGPALVGQSAACDLRLTDRQVSRRHLAFDLADRRLRLVDLQSTNGTSVHGVTVLEALLAGGEIVRLGETSLRVDLIAPSSLVAVSPSSRFGHVVGGSPEMRRLYPLLERLAASSVPVVIEGETGTGKEVVGESLHEMGPRGAGPFVVFDCTAVSPTLVESELFGHERGAFTGAVGAHKGFFEQAQGGTLLIDEIGDLPLALQPKLLRVLERSEVRRVGGQTTIRVDARVLCATRRNLDREVQAGRFRDDLFHRLAVARVELPPLRRRRGDIALLVSTICEQMGAAPSAIPEPLLRAWEDYAWPGNVRELRNAVARRLALGGLADLETSLRRPAASAPTETSAGLGALERVVAMQLPFPEARHRVIEELEHQYVEKVLAEHGGNVSKAADASGIARRQFQRVRGRTSK